MTPQAIYLFLDDMFFMDQVDFTILFLSIHMAEIAPVFRCDAVTFCDFGMTLLACIACF